tara:strand:- start:1288 stop:1458 length:171 start_codon:yes stop_codon:yes gene_type:complete
MVTVKELRSMLANSGAHALQEASKLSDGQLRNLLVTFMSLNYTDRYREEDERKVVG